MSLTFSLANMPSFVFKASPMPNFKKIHERENMRRVKDRPSPGTTVPHSFNLKTEKRSRANSRSNNLSPSTVSSSARKPLHMQRRVSSRLHIKMFSPRVSTDRNSELLTTAEVLRRISSADAFNEREAQRSIAEDVRAKMPPAPRRKNAMQPAGTLHRSTMELPSPHTHHSRNNTFMLNKSKAALLENSTFETDKP